MKQFSTTKYTSLFAPNQEVGIAAHIVEKILINKIEYRGKKGSKMNKPKCAFWRKEFTDKHPEFAPLSKDYMLELIFVKKLLNCFSPTTIIQYTNERGLITFVYLKQDQRKTLVYNLFEKEQEIVKQEREKRKKAEQVKPSKDASKVTKRKTGKTKLSGLI